MHSGEDKSNMVKLPEGIIPSVETTLNEVLERKYTTEAVTFDDSGDEEYFPVVYGTGGANEHTKMSNDIGERSNTESGSAYQKKLSQQIPQGKDKSSAHDQVKDGDFSSKDAREEVTNYEEIRNEATSKLNSIYEEIYPFIEAHGPENQDSVPTNVAEKWIDAQCSQYKADFDLYFSMIKNAMSPRPATDATAGPQTSNAEEGAGPQTANAEEGAGPQTATTEGGAE